MQNREGGGAAIKMVNVACKIEREAIIKIAGRTELRLDFFCNAEKKINRAVDSTKNTPPSAV